MNAPKGDAAVPSFCMLDLFVSDHRISCTRFRVTINADKLRGKGNLYNELNNYSDDIDDAETMFQFEEWVLGPLHVHGSPYTRAGRWEDCHAS